LLQSTEVAKNLEADLNRHGYGFQFAIVRAADALFDAKRSPWRNPVTEFPVEVKGQGTRIDVIFEHFEGHKYLICECKRTNPKLSDWCFLKLPRFFDSHADLSLFEVVRRTDLEVRAALSEPGTPGEIFHIAQEIKSQQKGDVAGRGRGVIEEAATQVLRGVNGLAEYFRGRPGAFGRTDVATLVPVIFTTARLWVSKVDLSMSDLMTGNIATNEEQLEQRGYLFYQYPQSPGLRHTLEYLMPSKPTGVNWRRNFNEVLYREYVRTIVIVSASGIEEYLSSEGFW